MMTHDAVKAIVTRFYERVFDDVMIGYMFQGKDRDRLIRVETELLLHHLDSSVRYTGRNIGPLHQPLKIKTGQFDRRQQIFREVLEEFSVEEETKRRWLSKNESMRTLITGS